MEKPLVAIADVGGTHTRFALARAGRDGPELGESEVLDSKGLGDFADAVGGFCEQRCDGAVRAVAVAVAGPVAEGARWARLTNLDLHVDADAIARRLRLERVLLVNDFSAQAASIPALKPAELFWHGPDGEPSAPCAVLGPGTGLGVSGWLGGVRVLQGEGGHVALVPADERERRVFPRLADETGFVAAEDMLCGSGLARLHAALRALDGLDDEPVKPAEVSHRAQRGEAQAVEAVRRFTAALGRVAGDLALTLGARSVAIGGGIVPHWGRDFDTHSFRDAFEAKGRYRGYMTRIPSATILHPQPGLLGLAQLALARVE